MRIIDIVSHPNVAAEELVWREPEGGSGDFRMGSRVIVQESQAAIFANQGQMLDVLGPGSHVLSTGNLPLLSRLIGMVTSGNNPFTADVYFVNLRDMPQVGWGTNPPIQMDIPNRSPGFMLLMSHGVVDIAISDPGRFAKQYAAGMQQVVLGDIRDRIQTMLLSTLAGLLSAQQISGIQAANAMLNNLEGASLALLNTQFAEIGMQIKAFRANPFQAKDLTPEDLVKYGGNTDNYRAIKALDVAQSAAQNPGMVGGLTGAGLGLSLGQTLGAQLNPQQDAMQQQMQQQQMMMQQMMMRMMEQNQQQGQPPPAAPAAPVAAPANPQTRDEIQALLDNLDMRLASGAITQDTYNTLVAKWQARLKALGG